MPAGPKSSLLGAVTGAAGALAETALQQSMATSSALLALQFNTKRPAVYAVLSTDTGARSRPRAHAAHSARRHRPQHARVVCGLTAQRRQLRASHTSCSSSVVRVKG